MTAYPAHYPRCTGCSRVFPSLEALDRHDCPATDSDDLGPGGHAVLADGGHFDGGVSRGDRR